MNTIIETERLIIRELLPEDEAGMFELDSDPEVHKYLGNKPIKHIDEARRVIELIRLQYETNGIGRWAMLEKSSGNFIGWTGLKLITIPINGHVNYYDLGYRMIKRYWGKGYATESAIASRDYAFNVLKTDKVYGMADIANTASCNVLQKTGLVYQHDFEYDGAPHAWFEMENRPEE